MARLQKLLERARNNPRGIRYSDLLTLVAAAGFVPLRQRGTSHQRFLLPARAVFLNLQSLPNSKAKDYQVLQFLKAVDEFGLLSDSEDKP